MSVAEVSTKPLHSPSEEINETSAERKLTDGMNGWMDRWIGRAKIKVLQFSSYFDGI